MKDLKEWNNLSTFFEFSPIIRKIIYTTNTLEEFNIQRLELYFRQ